MDMNVDKSVLRAILANTPDTQENAGLIDMVSRLMTKKDIIRKPFTYTTVFAAVAPGATPTNQIAIQADSDFLILAQTYHANQANAAQTETSVTYPLMTVLLTDTGSGSQLMDSAVSVPQIFGNGKFPFVLPEPQYLVARGNLAVQVANYDAAATYNLRLSFHGVKLFAPAG